MKAGPWTWRDGDGDPIDIRTYKPTGYSGNPRLCGANFKRVWNADYNFWDIIEWDDILGNDEYFIVEDRETAHLISKLPEILKDSKLNPEYYMAGGVQVLPEVDPYKSINIGPEPRQ